METSLYQWYGYVNAVIGHTAHIVGLSYHVQIGSIISIQTDINRAKKGEVIGFLRDKAIALMYDGCSDIGPGMQATILSEKFTISPDTSWMGRTINGLGEAIDNKGILLKGKMRSIVKRPLSAYTRNYVNENISLGIRSIDVFATCSLGQRVGIFASPGLGKTILLSQIANSSASDVVVLGLIGERGKEVRDFIDHHLTSDTLAKSVLVISTSDESPLIRKQAANIAITIAEYFRDEGKKVFCLIDNVTRFAHAQREIGLSVGESVVMKGYPPSIFSELPKLLERVGPGNNKIGSITGFFSILVEGGDYDDPIVDATMSILDGHIILSKKIAEKGRYPAIDILKSLSRTQEISNTAFMNNLSKKARKFVSDYISMEDLLKLGAYKYGSNKEMDQAIDVYLKIENFLSGPPIHINKSFELLNTILNG